MSTLFWLIITLGMPPLLAVPRWHIQGTTYTGSFLRASQCYDEVGKRKTAGDLASTLQLNIWRRAEEPGMLTYILVGCGSHYSSFTSLESPLWFKNDKPHYVADHPVPSFLGHKIAHLLHDFHREWFPRLGLSLPPSNGKHKQPTPLHVKKLLWRLHRSQDYGQARHEISMYSTPGASSSTASRSKSSTLTSGWTRSSLSPLPSLLHWQEARL